MVEAVSVAACSFAEEALVGVPVALSDDPLELPVPDHRVGSIEPGRLEGPVPDSDTGAAPPTAACGEAPAPGTEVVAAPGRPGLLVEVEFRPLALEGNAGSFPEEVSDAGRSALALTASGHVNNAAITAPANKRRSDLNPPRAALHRSQCVGRKQSLLH